MSRIIFNCLSLLGSGHFMRMSLLARHLAEKHEVILLDGGRPVSEQIPVPGVNVVELPRICRRQRNIEAYQLSESLPSIVAARRRRLETVCRELPPDAIVIDQFPFNKWVTAEETLSMIQLARLHNPRSKVVCSVRTPAPFRDLTGTREQRQQQVLRTLNGQFDALLIHTDPQFMPLAVEHPWISDLRIPSCCTGFVCQPEADSVPPATREHSVKQTPRSGILVSAGGDGGTLLRRCSIEAWKLLAGEDSSPPGRMTVVLPLEPDQQEVQELIRTTEGLPIQIEPFSPQFFGWLQQAKLSISQSGYNTCSDLLQTRTPAILVPHQTAADQLPRALEFHRRGLAVAIRQDDLSGPALAAAIRHSLAQPAPQHEFDLNGVQRSCEFIDQLLLQQTEGTASAAHSVG